MCSKPCLLFSTLIQQHIGLAEMNFAFRNLTRKDRKGSR